MWRCPGALDSHDEQRVLDSWFNRYCLASALKLLRRRFEAICPFDDELRDAMMRCDFIYEDDLRAALLGECASVDEFYARRMAVADCARHLADVVTYTGGEDVQGPDDGDEVAPQKDSDVIDEPAMTAERVVNLFQDALLYEAKCTTCLRTDRMLSLEAAEVAKGAVRRRLKNCAVCSWGWFCERCGPPEGHHLAARSADSADGNVAATVCSSYQVRAVKCCFVSKLPVRIGGDSLLG